ncbi:MAG: PAS domain S-box protein, partial [Sulfurimonadaceae bacterium]|nr:PAS domain S-box protein [Sulfurimonadaceae bacterium]
MSKFIAILPENRNEYRLIQLTLIVVSLVAVVVAVTLYLLYNDTMERERHNLQETVEGERQLIESIGRFMHQQHTADHHHGDPVKATLQQVVDARLNLPKEHAHSEFVLGRQVNDSVWLIINNDSIEATSQCGGDVEQCDEVVTMPIDSPQAESMRLALEGKQGTVITTNYKGIDVLAAYAPVKIGEAEFGLVTTFELDSISGPFMNRAFLIVAISAVVVVFGVLLFHKLAFPIISELKQRVREYRRLNKEHKKIQQELEARERQMRSLIENIPGGTFRFDVDTGKIVYVSAQIEELTGYTAGEFYDDSKRCIQQLLGEQTQQNRDRALDALMNNTGYILEYQMTKRDGKSIWVREQGQQIYDSVKKTHWLDGVIFDITDEKMLHEELGRRVDEGIQKLREKDEMLLHNARLAAMGEMIGMIAHQWRQPIAGIGMVTNNLLLDIELGTLEADKTKEELVLVDQQVQYLSKTIEDFTNFFKPKSETESCTIGELVDDTLKIIGKSLANSNVDISVSVEREKTIKVYKSELMQVLLNLIKNAQDVFKEEERKDGLILVQSYEH